MDGMVTRFADNERFAVHFTHLFRPGRHWFALPASFEVSDFTDVMNFNVAHMTA